MVCVRFSYVSVQRKISFSFHYLPFPPWAVQICLILQYRAELYRLCCVTKLDSVKRTAKRKRIKASALQREPLNSTMQTLSAVFISSRTENRRLTAGSPTSLMFCRVQSYFCQESYNGTDIHFIAILKMTSRQTYVANQTFLALFPLWVRVSCGMRIWII